MVEGTGRDIDVIVRLLLLLLTFLCRFLAVSCWRKGKVRVIRGRK